MQYKDIFTREIIFYLSVHFLPHEYDIHVNPKYVPKSDQIQNISKTYPIQKTT